MEDMYASAYCTLAATAANDSTTSFLIGRKEDQCFLVKD